MNKLLHYPDYDVKCKKLCKMNEVRFAGIVDEQGELVAGGFKKDLVPLERDEQKLKEFMKFISSISLLRSFDEELGPTSYIAVRREKIILLSFPFPLSKIILLISSEPCIDIESFAARIVDIFDYDQARFSER